MIGAGRGLWASPTGGSILAAMKLGAGVEMKLTRREVLQRGARGLPGVLVGGSLLAGTARAARRRVPRSSRRQPQLGLPSSARVREDFTTMVQFGPRLTASSAHDAYVDWLEEQFVDAGLKMLPRDDYTTDRWLVERVLLDILDGPAAGPVKVATYYPRSQQTGPEGVTGPLVYGGTAPAPSVSFTTLADLEASLARYPSELASWATGIQSLAGGEQGAILLVDVPAPVPMTAGALMPISTFQYWPGHTLADWVAAEFKRLWLIPGLQMPLAPFQQTGAQAVVFILDASYEALAGGYLPFDQSFQPLPALYVDRDTGRALRAQARGRPRTRLTLTASRQPARTQAITAVLPGASEEVIIFNTHTDGQGFVEENGGVAFVELARYFASLRASKRLRRTLVFACWPGHMVADLPQTQGWIDAHHDIVARAAAALTVEHLGCREWNDTVGSGYHPTGLHEMFFVWTTQGKMFELTRDTVVAHRLARTALMRPPLQFGVGSPYQSAGVPQIGAIAGPEYLLTVSADGDLDKLDEHLAARQISWLADLAHRLDPVPASVLRQGDPTLGVSV
jgi:hypothetical protein